jgi:hypothetical protein
MYYTSWKSGNRSDGRQFQSISAACDPGPLIIGNGATTSSPGNGPDDSREPPKGSQGYASDKPPACSNFTQGKPSKQYFKRKSVIVITMPLAMAIE